MPAYHPDPQSSWEFRSLQKHIREHDIHHPRRTSEKLIRFRKLSHCFLRKYRSMYGCPGNHCYFQTRVQQEQANLPKNILERRQNELEQLNQRAVQMRQDAQQELEKSWIEMLEPIAKKIDDAIKAVGQEGGYVYIFDLNATQIPFINETYSTDVTATVKAKLGLQ